MALDANGVSVYPCKVLNRFACPYDKKNNINFTLEDDNIKRPDFDYLFYLSEIAFAVELALAKATEQDSKVYRNNDNNYIKFYRSAIPPIEWFAFHNYYLINTFTTL